MSLKTATKTTGNGLLNFIGDVVTTAHNGPRKERIEAIDKTITMLMEERAQLVEELIET
jgi:hypothetical protein